MRQLLQVHTLFLMAMVVVIQVIINLILLDQMQVPEQKLLIQLLLMRVEILLKTQHTILIFMGLMLLEMLGLKMNGEIMLFTIKHVHE